MVETLGPLMHFPFLARDCPGGHVVHGVRLQGCGAKSGPAVFGSRAVALGESWPLRAEVRASVFGGLGSCVGGAERFQSEFVCNGDDEEAELVCAGEEGLLGAGA